MQYSHPDDELVKQPIGYWAWAAANAVVDYISSELDAVGLSQPQWWTLNQVKASEHGMTRERVTALLEGHLGAGDALQREIDAVLDWGLLVLDDEQHLQVTAEGRAVHQQAADIQATARAIVHDGIPDADYLTTLKVLQQMIHNVGGSF